MHRYASRARKIVNVAMVNEDSTVKIIGELRAKVERLTHEVSRLKSRETHLLSVIADLEEKAEANSSPRRKSAVVPGRLQRSGSTRARSFSPVDDAALRSLRSFNSGRRFTTVDVPECAGCQAAVTEIHELAETVKRYQLQKNGRSDDEELHALQAQLQKARVREQELEDQLLAKVSLFLFAPRIDGVSGFQICFCLICAPISLFIHTLLLLLLVLLRLRLRLCCPFACSCPCVLLWLLRF